MASALKTREEFQEYHGMDMTIVDSFSVYVLHIVIDCVTRVGAK